MDDYHVGCGTFGIYAGTLNKKGDMWRNKSEVTHEVLCAAAQYLMFNHKEFHVQYENKWYVMRIEELEGGQDETN